MYIVTHKETKDILHINTAPASQGLSGTEVYFHYDSKTMNIIETNEEIPHNLDLGMQENQTSTEPEKIGVNGPDSSLSETHNSENDLDPRYRMIIEEGGEKVVMKTMDEQLADGTLNLDEPFEKLIDGEIVAISIHELLEKNLLVSSDQCIRATGKMNKRIDYLISLEYNPGYEMKITKNYLSWIKDGQPENDEREKVFNQMQETIESIKSEFADLKELIKNRQVEIERDIKTGRK